MESASLIVAEASRFAEWDPNPTTRAYVAARLQPTPVVTELEPLFGKRIRFGTAGLRARMAPGISCINDLVVLQTAQGICRYAQRVFGIERLKSQGIVVGYDHRRSLEFQLSSKRFAEITTIVFASEGIPVYLFGEIVATPFVPFCIVQRQCCAGIMVTASHNPKEDNGYKIYWNDGVQITAPHDSGIAKSILDNLEPWPKVRQLLKEDAPTFDVVSDPTQELTEAYFRINTTKLARHPPPSDRLDIMYTAMHGVGHKWAQKMFQSFDLAPFIPVPSQVAPDPDFPTTRKPNPEERGALDDAKAVATEGKLANRNKLILANDPDADRLAVAEYDVLDGSSQGTWATFSGNEIGVMLAHWQWENRLNNNVATAEETQASRIPQKYAMVTTTVSSRMLERMAKVEGFYYEETLTGFKWLGNCCKRLQAEGYKVLLSYEEAIGFCLSDEVFDKDGINAAAVFAELAVRIASRSPPHYFSKCPILCLVHCF